MSFLSNITDAYKNLGSNISDIYKYGGSTPDNSGLFGANSNFSSASYTVPKPAANTSSGGGAGASTDYLSLYKSLLNSQNSAPPPLPTLPAFSISDTFNQARQQATSNVSPYYEQQLNLFKTTQDRKRQQASEDEARITGQAQQDYDTAIADLTAADATTRERTAQDTSTAIGQLNQGQSANDVASARDFVGKYRNMQQGLSNSGLTFSGIGQQQQNEALAAKAEGEAQTTAQYTAAKEAKNLFQNRTFEDLANSEALAKKHGTTQLERTKQGAQVNYDRTIADLLDEEVSKSRDIEFEKQQAIGQQTGTAAKDIFSRFLSSLKNPQQTAYANEVYGGAF